MKESSKSWPYQPPGLVFIYFRPLFIEISYSRNTDDDLKRVEAEIQIIKSQNYPDAEWRKTLELRLRVCLDKLVIIYWRWVIGIADGGWVPGEYGKGCWQCGFWWSSRKKGAGKLGEVSLILGGLSDILASGASPSALKRMKFSESATIMHFDAHKKFEFDQITLSSSKWWLSLKVIKWSFWWW